MADGGGLVDEGGFGADGSVEAGFGFDGADVVDPAVWGDAESAQDSWRRSADAAALAGMPVAAGEVDELDVVAG